MLKKWLCSSAKLVLIALVSALGLSVSHLGVNSATSSMNMGQHSTVSNVQCQSSCITATPTKKEDRLLQTKENDKRPIPQPSYALMLSGGVLAALFIVKRSASFIASWCPPDLLTLYGRYIVYA